MSECTHGIKLPSCVTAFCCSSPACGCRFVVLWLRCVSFLIAQLSLVHAMQHERCCACLCVCVCSEQQRLPATWNKHLQVIASCCMYLLHDHAMVHANFHALTAACCVLTSMRVCVRCVRAVVICAWRATKQRLVLAGVHHFSPGCRCAGLLLKPLRPRRPRN